MADSKNADVFAVFDLDRTLIDTDKFVEKLRLATISQNLNQELVDEAFSSLLKKNGESIDAFEHLENRLQISLDPSQLFEQMKDEFSECVFSGVVELFKSLEQYEIPAGILTYGEERFQSFKLGLLHSYFASNELNRLPAMVTQSQQKARMISTTWLHSHQGWHIPDVMIKGETLFAKRIIIIDDKISNLEANTDSIIGVLVDNTGSLDGVMAIDDITAEQLMG